MMRIFPYRSFGRNPEEMFEEVGILGTTGDQFRTTPGVKSEVVKGTKSSAIHAFQKR